MSTRYEQLGKQNTFDDDVAETADHEISLGTTTVLGIFVALALVCALFFGFGYSMGRRSTPPILGGVDAHVSTPSPNAQTSDSGAESITPPSAASSPELDARSTPESAPKAAEPAPRVTVHKPTPQQATPTAVLAAATPARSTAASTAPDATTPPAHPTLAAAKPASPPPTAPVSAGQTYVQVAAISHREDADLLLASLRRRGYAATARPGAQDNLLHIQVGPLASKKDAEAMRQRLLGDGYNAIVK